MFHNESVCNGLHSENKLVTDMNSSQKQRIFDSSVTQAQLLESLKDGNQFLGDGSSSTTLIKTLSSPFSLRVGAVEKMLWFCGVVVGSVFCLACFFVLLSLRFLLSPPSFHHSRGPSHSLNPSLRPPGVFVFSPLPSLALSGSGPVIRPRTPVRALPTPKQQLALQGEAGECVHLPLCLLAVICLSVP